jgi:hypothetical protein
MELLHIKPINKYPLRINKVTCNRCDHPVNASGLLKADFSGKNLA